MFKQEKDGKQKSLTKTCHFVHNCKTTAKACKIKIQPIDPTMTSKTRMRYGSLSPHLSVESRIRLENRVRRKTYNGNAGGLTLPRFLVMPEELSAETWNRLEGVWSRKCCRVGSRIDIRDHANFPAVNDGARPVMPHNARPWQCRS